MKEKFTVTGMTCSACSSHVEKAVKKQEGVRSVAVNLLQNSMMVEYDQSISSTEKIIAAVEAEGYGVWWNGQDDRKENQEKKKVNHAQLEIEAMKRRLVGSAVFLIPLLYIAMGGMMGLPIPRFLEGAHNAITYGMAQLLLTLPILYLNRHYFENGFKSLIRRAPTMDALIAIGSTAAVVYGIYAIIKMGHGLAVQDFELVHQYHMDLYFESAGTILTLITVGKYMESRSKGKTSDAISRLMDLAPKSALVERNGIVEEIPVEQVMPGDVLHVKPGSAIPVDGVVIEGIAAIDQSAITGESIPVEKTVGDSVTGATINNAGFIKMKASRVGEDTTLSQIIRLVEDAGASKAPIAKLADKVSAVFVPVVISIAILATIVWLLLGYPVSFSLSIGIAVLVISCPCALGLATPTAIMVGTGKGAEHGILFKNAESIETAHTIQTVILDKTGTVTVGKPSVVKIYPAVGVEEKRFLSLAASVEKMSEHPLAGAIIDKAAAGQAEILPGQFFQQIPGQGIQAEIDGGLVRGGNRPMMEAAKINVKAFSNIAGEIAENGQTALYFAWEDQLLGVLAVADTIKPSSKAAIDALLHKGIEVILLTGDNQQTAQAIARQLGVQKVIAGVLPQDKEQQVRKQQEQGKKVAMIGDGINDAPALTRADVGIAIGAGTDIAIESADVVLIKSDLLDAVTALELSHATIRNIKQNLFWAFFYNALGIPLAAGLFYPLFGWKLSPMFASAAMSVSSLFVVTNALRLRFFRPQAVQKPEESISCADQLELNNKGEKTMTVTMTIEGMSCNHCKANVERVLGELPGIQAAVDLEAGTATIQTEGAVDSEKLAKVVTEAGYTVIAVS